MMLLKQTVRRSYVFDRSQKVSPRGFPCCSVEVIATYLVCEMMEGKSTRPGCGGEKDLSDNHGSSSTWRTKYLRKRYPLFPPHRFPQRPKSLKSLQSNIEGQDDELRCERGGMRTWS